MTKILIGPAYPLRGGIADFNQALALAYNSLKSQSKIYSFSLQYPNFLFPGKTQFSNGEKPHEIEIRTCINSINPFNWFKVSKLIIKEKPEYVVIHYWIPFMAPCLGFIARRVKKRTKTKVIGIIHNIIPHESFPFSKQLNTYFTKSCDGFISMSKSVLNDLDKFTSTKNKKYTPHPIYNTFGNIVSKEESLKHLNLSPNYKYILFFGIIRNYKGLDILLEAFAKIDYTKLKLKLIVAGEFYDDKTYYTQLISNLNIEEHIILSNEFISNSEVKYYFGASDIIAQTYKSATQSGVTQIAYHFERPMLVTDVGGLSEIIPHQKVGYVTKVNPDSIAESLVDFFENSREDEFSKNVSMEKKKFSWDILINSIEELL